MQLCQVNISLAVAGHGLPLCGGVVVGCCPCLHCVALECCIAWGSIDSENPAKVSSQLCCAAGA